MTIVRAKDELEEAINRGEGDIVIEGSLAKQVRTARRLKTYGAAAIAALGAAIAAAPFTAGSSLIGAGAIAALTGTEIAVIIVCLSVGLGLLLAIWSGYEEVSFEPGPLPRLVLRKKQKA